MIGAKYQNMRCGECGMYPRDHTVRSAWIRVYLVGYGWGQVRMHGFRFGPDN